ncbi:MAG: monofunctional biosynthetic peptidoglycan transglycosylase [Chitinophagaceae bacterium]|nr:MAG: monofunctional biosynthetic peptidoglycan transglycosylase [Chitinophagaceae bacterium]
MPPPTRSRISLLLRRLRRLTVFLLCAQLAYLLLCRFVNPPLTFTQLSFIVRAGDSARFDRRHIPISGVSGNVIRAVLAAEDLWFFSHSGFDWESIRKNQERNRAGGQGGGSSISQQTAKNVFLWQGGGWVRKGLEAWFTWAIERAWGKKRILEVYLNVAETGPGLFGVEAAAQHYFGKPARALGREEAALLAVCLPAPRRLSPDMVCADPALYERYQVVLQTMDVVEVIE